MSFYERHPKLAKIGVGTAAAAMLGFGAVPAVQAQGHGHHPMRAPHVRHVGPAIGFGFGYGWGPFGYPWWWNDSPYFMGSWSRMMYYQNEHRNEAKENYNIYRLSTGTPVALEDLVFDSNVLGLSKGQMKQLTDLRVDYMKQFWEAGIKDGSKPDKVRDEQLSILDHYKKDLGKMLKADEQANMQGARAE